MLQWMGGSRRKVTTSKKSVQKRQKQYFEQRKRQQQNQQAASVEHVPDEEKGCQENHNNNRSLDVLSLLNLSTVTRGVNSCCPSDGENFSRSNQSTQSSPAIQTNEVNRVGLQPMEARMSPCQVAATTHRLKESINADGCEDKFSVEKHETLNNSKIVTEHQLSVIDLVGDGPSCKSDEVSLREAHVAFSIKGLGKVITETPVHSPEPCARTLSHGFASPSKTKRHSQVVKNFSCGLSTVDPEQNSMWDINLPFHTDVMEQPFCSKSPGEYLGNRKSTFSTKKKLRQQYSNNFNSMDSCKDNGLFYNGIAGSNCFLPNILDEEEYSLSPESKNGFSDDYLNIRDPATQEFTNEGYYQDNSRRDFNATRRSKILDIQDLYCQPFSSESQTNCNTADEIWTSKFDDISGVRQVGNNTSWPYFNDENGVESLLSLSEESRRGVTVKDSTLRPAFNTLEKKWHNANHRKSVASTYASCSKFLQEDYNFCKPFSDMRTHDNILPDTASANSKPKFYEDSKKCQRELLDGLDCMGSADSSDTNGDAATRSLLSDEGKYDLWSSKLNIPQDSVKGQKDWNPLHGISSLRSEKNSNQDLCKNTGSTPITNEKFDRQDISGSNSFEVGNLSNPSGSEGRCSKYKSSTNRSPEKNSSRDLETELDAEDKLSAVELSDISDDTESVQYKTVCKQDSVTPVTCQDKREEPEDSGVVQRKVAKKTGIHPTRQEVLLIEGCVLQLLHVQVVKDVPPDISQKKVSLLQRSTSS